MDNEGPVSGIQFDLSAVPDYLTLVDASATARVPEDWNITVAEQEDGKH